MIFYGQMAAHVALNNPLYLFRQLKTGIRHRRVIFGRFQSWAMESTRVASETEALNISFSMKTV